MERVVFLRVETVPPAMHRRDADEMMDIDIDIEDDVPRVYASSSAAQLVLHLNAPHIHPDLKVFILDIHDDSLQVPRVPRLPLPSPEAQTPDTARGVRAVEVDWDGLGWEGEVESREAAARDPEERERAVGGGGVGLDCSALDAARGFARHVAEARAGYMYAGGYVEDGFGFRYASAGGGAGYTAGLEREHEQSRSSSARAGRMSCPRVRRMVGPGWGLSSAQAYFSPSSFAGYPVASQHHQRHQQQGEEGLPDAETSLFDSGFLNSSDAAGSPTASSPLNDPVSPFAAQQQQQQQTLHAPQPQQQQGQQQYEHGAEQQYPRQMEQHYLDDDALADTLTYPSSEHSTPGSSYVEEDVAAPSSYVDDASEPQTRDRHGSRWAGANVDILVLEHEDLTGVKWAKDVRLAIT
ncbi:hypothetical protein DFH08DRAFT_951008 [Mycena albidolilacea]|uniref:Uncharacterized protein n=1 Tax=Mycena albidolilacea TaxID=1033008 RepID=A0AAD7AMD0_9AGAR|nr:hypothetical protein DFH08DRAFT_951008 [Mycena albidolilacea]